MSNLLIAVDRAKDVFELAVARPSGKVVERKRLTRAQFEAPRGATKLLERLPQLLEHHRDRLPERVRRLVLAFWTEANELEAHMREIEQELETLAKQEPVIQTLLEIPGIGVLTATAFFASVGNPARGSPILPVAATHNANSATSNSAVTIPPSTKL